VLTEWIINRSILSLAVEGNIDQSQYCEKIKTIVEFIGDRINNEEIKNLWNMQVIVLIRFDSF
jgi:ubiquitin carboxyl-terminal hydrolase 9/24